MDVGQLLILHRRFSWRLDELTPKNLPRLVQEARGALNNPEADVVDELELRVALALVILSQGIPWAPDFLDHHRAILDLVRMEHPEQPDRQVKSAVDCTAAYGINWRRSIRPGVATSLENRWPAAFDWLVIE